MRYSFLYGKNLRKILLLIYFSLFLFQKGLFNNIFSLSFLSFLQ